MVTACPEECRCNSRKQVYCNNRNLARLPDNIPNDTKVLHLQDNQLVNSVELQEKLGKLKKLERLMFYSNNLDTIPKLASPNLRELRLNNNRIKSISAGCFDDVPNLTELILDGNLLTNAGIDIRVFEPLTELKRVSFTNNFLTEFPVNLPVSLNHIFLSDNQLSYVSFDSLKHLSNLETLYLNRNKLSDGSFEQNALGSLHRLREFEISYNLLNHVPSNLQPSIEKLHMTSNKIEFIRSKEFRSLTQLRNIDLAYNRLRAIEHGTLDNLTGLDRIDLSGNNWHCDCNLKSLKVFLNNNGVHRGVREPLICGDSNYGGTNLDFIHEDSLQCEAVNFNITQDDKGIVLESKSIVGIVPPFGDYKVRAQKITPTGLNLTSVMDINPPERLHLESLEPGAMYRICLFNEFDQLHGDVVPDRYCTTYKTSETLVTVQGAQGASEKVIAIALGLILTLIAITIAVVIALRRRGLCLINNKDLDTSVESLDKAYRLYQTPTQMTYGQSATPAMTLDASKEFNVTLMLRNTEQPNAPQMTQKFKQEYNHNRDSGIYSNMRNNSLSGSTSTGSGETEKTLLQSSRTDLGIYL